MKSYDQIHYSVMKKESIDALCIKPDGIYLDCTTGAGGHSFSIAEQLSGDGRLICLDTDKNALAIAMERLSRYSDKVTFVNSNFCEVGRVLDELGIQKVDGAIIDLGVSSMQLREADRGFAYMLDGPLDMRMNPDADFSAYDVVNNYSEDELKRVLKDWGEEKFAPQIARKIVSKRQEAPIETTYELVSVIESAVPGSAKKNGHPAKRTFQAIRIEVNRELDIIKPTLETLIDRLNKEGILAVITFHSLEDRIVKHTFSSKTGKCTCPPGFPVCVCGCKAEIKVYKDVAPSKEEIEKNPPSHSARLRCAKKL
jgi:16S rRNA (cytosine1402-N4)-methyltransferase